MTEILNTQRLKRPSSPHFTIYQPQLTWLASIANRMTGSALSVRAYQLWSMLRRLYSSRTVIYGYALAYLAAPGVFDSAHVIEFVGALPEAVKYTGKVLLAAPFAMHSWNGVRHLVWDTGRCTSLRSTFATVVNDDAVQSSVLKEHTRPATLCLVPPLSRLSRSSSCDIAVIIKIEPVRTCTRSVIVHRVGVYSSELPPTHVMRGQCSSEAQY